MSSGKRYVLAAGGTGGHMVPAAALAAAGFVGGAGLAGAGLLQLGLQALDVLALQAAAHAVDLVGRELGKHVLAAGLKHAVAVRL